MPVAGKDLNARREPQPQRALGIGKLENHRHRARLRIDPAADGDQRAIAADVDGESLIVAVHRERRAARLADTADVAFRHPGFQPELAGVGDMQQRRAFIDEGPGGGRHLSDDAIHRRLERNATAAAELLRPCRGRLHFGVRHALIGAGIEQAFLGDCLFLEQQLHPFAFAPGLFERHLRLAGRRVEAGLIAIATETRAEHRQHLPLFDCLPDARETVSRAQHASGRRHQLRLAARWRPDRAGGGNRGAREALDRFRRGEIDLPLLLLAEGDAFLVMRMAAVS